MRFAIEGQIDNVGAADIFFFLSQTQRTSLVAFERPDQETRVFFVDGQPVWCLTSKLQLQIETRLAAGGAIKLRDIETALGRQNAAGNRVPQALIAEIMATETSMEMDLRALSLEVLRDLATWTSGGFTVYDGVAPPPWAHTITPDFSLLLVEALRAQCQKEVLQKEFISRRAILRTRIPARSVAGLNDAERAVLNQANGERNLEEIVKGSQLDEPRALAAMHVLCALRLTDLLSAPRGAKSGTEKAATGPTPMPAPAPVRAPPSDKGAVTNEFRPPPEPKKVSPPVAAPKAPDPDPHTGDSTAKIEAPLGLTAPKNVVRVLRITSEGKTRDLVLAAGTFAIGRHPRNDLVLNDPRISSFHCRLETEGSNCVLLDLKSRNGTLLNSARIERAVLKHNDQIQLGSTKVSFLET